VKAWPDAADSRHAGLRRYHGLDARTALEGRMSEVLIRSDERADVLAFEWHPGQRTYAWWTLLGALLGAGGGLVYLWIAGHFRLPDYISVNIGLTLALILALGAAHEAVHGVATMVFGARPEFGVLRQGRIPLGFYTTTPGYRFGRNAYLTVALAPLVLIAPLSAVLCWSPLGEALWLPLGVHLGGCIGDLTIARHVLRSPRQTQCEDLRDGMRLWLRAADDVPS
jgi:hypothetical protein